MFQAVKAKKVYISVLQVKTNGWKKIVSHEDNLAVCNRGLGSQWISPIHPTFTAGTRYLAPCEITVQQAVKVASKHRNRLEPRGCGLCDSDMDRNSCSILYERTLHLIKVAIPTAKELVTLN